MRHKIEEEPIMPTLVLKPSDVLEAVRILHQLCWSIRTPDALNEAFAEQGEAFLARVCGRSVPEHFTQVILAKETK